ncbi:PREDICTED: uncharacterized protein LOC109582575 [Amphimedon queenslandica]|nr:PREDICTED: uncharacterized protein LOC109582575 [Amphimedon queenslandica]|eukprot:XP_019852893.1 PREDICTED: uncharacterized protein LOC109582575 [Amphimedon queenslandica]
MSGILFKSFSCLFLVLLLQQSVPTVEGVPLASTNCTLYKNVMGGTEAIRVYMARLYNYQIALEGKSYNNDSFIASNLFKGLQVIGTAGFYNRLLQLLNKNEASKNYTGFDNLDMTGFYSEMFSQIITDTCTWLNSYGDALTLRTGINCSHPAEQLMLTQFSIIMPLIRSFDQKFREQFNCTPKYYQHWIDENLLGSHQPEINYLQRLVGDTLSGPTPSSK